MIDVHVEEWWTWSVSGAGGGGRGQGEECESPVCVQPAGVERGVAAVGCGCTCSMCSMETQKGNAQWGGMLMCTRARVWVYTG